ncbi:MAG: TIGR01777 family oxidoreductase, partial [Limisphaerales bacterium]
KRIVLAGGSGFIGSALATEWLTRNCEVIVLTRSPVERKDGVKEIAWNAEHIGEWIQFLDGVDAVVNLTGKNINCPHTPENVRELTASRVNSVRAIAAALEHVKQPPRVWVQASAIGFYGDQKEKICNENSPDGSDALAEICRQWENAFNSAKSPKTRKVLLRIGFVLGKTGGALPVLAKLTKWFLGGRAGDGKQFISWIHLNDLTRMFIEGVERENLSGTFNAVAPNPVTNRNFMRELRRALHRPWSPPAPGWAVKFGSRLMKSEPSLALAGCRVAPKRFLESGFKFQFAELRGALKNIYQ